MKKSKCTECIHYNVCQFVNNKTAKEDWVFMDNNFIIECKQYKNQQKLATLHQKPITSQKVDKVDVDKIIKEIDKCFKMELMNGIKSVYK